MSTAKQRYYDPALLEDAPGHRELARSLGTLTWDTWDADPRPAAARIADFVAAYPPENPVRHLGALSNRRLDGSLSLSTPAASLQRLLARDWTPGSLHELAARFGLRFRGGPVPIGRDFQPADMKSTAKRRNLRLRVLHGGVDVEPGDMDAAKAALLDRKEKQVAAEQVREARRRMAEDLVESKPK